MFDYIIHKYIILSIIISHYERFVNSFLRNL